MRVLLSFVLVLSSGLALPNQLGERDNAKRDADHSPSSNFTIYASHYSGNVHTLQFEPGLGRVYATQVLQSCGKKPSWLTIDRESKTLYCLDESGDPATGEPGHLYEYAIRRNGTLEERAKVETAPGPVHATLYGKEKKFIAIASFRKPIVQTFALPLKNLGKPMQSLQLDDSDKSEPYAVYLDPIRQSFIFVLDKGTDTIYIYAIDNDGYLKDWPCDKRKANRDYSVPRLGIRRAAFIVSGQDEALLYWLSDITNYLGRYNVKFPTDNGGTSDACPSLIPIDGPWINLRNSTENSHPLDNESYFPELKSIDNRDFYLTKCNPRRFTDSIFEYCVPNTHDSCGYKGDSDQDLVPTIYRKPIPTYGHCPRSFDLSPNGLFMAIGNRISSNVIIVPRDPKSHGSLGDLIAEIPVSVEGSPRQRNGLSSVIWGIEV